MRKEKVYICGQITGLCPETVNNSFKFRADMLKKQGYTPVNPIDLVGDFNTNWYDAMKICIPALLTCDCIFVMQNWRNSLGAKIEISISKHLSKKFMGSKVDFNIEKKYSKWSGKAFALENLDDKYSAADMLEFGLFCLNNPKI